MDEIRIGDDRALAGIALIGQLRTSDVGTEIAYFIPAETVRSILYAVEMAQLYASQPRRLLRKTVRRKIAAKIARGKRRIARRQRAWDARQAKLNSLLHF